MSQSFTNLIYHIVFSTKNREATIIDDFKPRLYEYIGGTIRGLGGVSLGIGGTADHIHILVKLRADKAISDVMRDVKANASGWIHKNFPDKKTFSWQRGCGAFTVSASQIKIVQKYVANQEEHHKRCDYQDEFEKMLHANEIDFEKEYLWK